MRPDLWFDVYPYDNPQAGARLVRLTKDQLLASSRFRVERRGPGSGQIVLNSGQAEFTAANLHEENLVEVGDFNVSATVPLGGFFLQRGDFQVISVDEAGGENFPIGGPGLLSYTAREILWSHTYITSGGAMDPFGDLWRFGNQGLWAGGSRLGAFAHRAVTECLLFRSGAYTHRHGDGLTYTDTHPDDRVGSSHISLLTMDFSELLDSDGNAFPDYDGEFNGRVKQTLYSLLLDLISKGLDLQMRGGRQLLLSAYNSYGRDLRGGAFGAGVVRFVHGENIANPARRAIEASQRASRALVGRDDQYALVNSPVSYHVGRSIGVDSDAESATGFASDGDAELRRRKDGSDVPALKGAYGDDEANGLYLFAPPEVGGHAWVGDLVKIHRGSGPFQWNNEDARIEAIQFDLTEERIWDDPTIEFGSVYRPASERGRVAELQSVAAKPHGPHTELCRAGINVNRLLNLASGSIKVSSEHGANPRTEAVDGDDATASHWSAATAAGVDEEYWAGDLGQAREITQYRVKQGFGDGSGDPEGASEMRLYGSNNSAAWTWLPSGKLVADPAANGWTQVAVFAGSTTGSDTGAVPVAAASYRYWLLRAAVGPVAGTGNGWNVQEFELFSFTGGDGHPLLIGSGTRAKRCSDTEHYRSTDAPTSLDDGAHGFRVGTVWHRLDSLATPTQMLGTWLLASNAAGAAVWMPLETTLTVQDEGVALVGGATVLNFTGGGVTATGSGTTKTVNIPAPPTEASDLTTHYEPMVDSGGDVMIDSAGFVHMHEVTH